MIRVDMNLVEQAKIDYVYCMTYRGSYPTTAQDAHDIQDIFNTIECNLGQPQRCSQEILAFADFYQMHRHYHDGEIIAQKQYSNSATFSSSIPLWIELDHKKSFFHLDFWDEIVDCKDVLVTYGHSSDEHDDITRFCKKNTWACFQESEVRGSEAAVVVIYQPSCYVSYELLTRAKQQLVIVAVRGKVRYLSYILVTGL